MRYLETSPSVHDARVTDGVVGACKGLLVLISLLTTLTHMSNFMVLHLTFIMDELVQGYYSGCHTWRLA